MPPAMSDWEAIFWINNKAFASNRETGNSSIDSLRHSGALLAPGKIAGNVDDDIDCTAASAWT